LAERVGSVLKSCQVGKNLNPQDFWGVEELIRDLAGVNSTVVGYTGGNVKNATYRNHGTHAEAIGQFRSGRTLLPRVVGIFLPDSRSYYQEQAGK